MLPFIMTTCGDCLELERGATNIQSYADLVLDNNGQLSESAKRLVLFAEGKGSAPTREGGGLCTYLLKCLGTSGM